MCIFQSRMKNTHFCFFGMMPITTMLFSLYHGRFYDISASFLMLFEMLNQCAFFVEMCILYTRNIMNVTKWGDWGR